MWLRKADKRQVKKMQHAPDYASLEYMKVVVAPLAAIIIAAVGWALTTAYNRTQLSISAEKNAADVEVARINAALSFANTYRQINSDDLEQRDQAVAIAAPVLGPDLAFDLAIKMVTRNQTTLKVLLEKYGDDSWNYVSAALEIRPVEYDDPTVFGNERISSGALPFDAGAFERYRTSRVESNARARVVISFLDQQHLLDELTKFIFTGNYRRPGSRADSILQVFRYRYDRIQYPANTAAEIQSEFARISALLSDSDVAEDAKQSIAIAAALIYDPFHSNDEFASLVVPFFWDGLDLQSGETPAEYDLRSFVYRDRFHNERGEDLPMTNQLSVELARRLKLLPFESLDSKQISLIMYSYMESTPRGSKNPFSAYLTPGDALEVIKLILPTLTSLERRRTFVEEMGSLSGMALYKNISQNKEIRHEYAILIIGWHNINYEPGWYTPKFFADMIDDMPDLAPMIDRKRYGFGSVEQQAQ